MIGELGQEVYMSTAEQCLLEAHASGVEKMMNDGPCQWKLLSEMLSNQRKLKMAHAQQISNPNLTKLLW